MGQEIYAILNKGNKRRIIALTDRPGLEAFKPEFRETSILLDDIQVPDILRYMKRRGGLSSKRMPIQYLENLD